MGATFPRVKNWAPEILTNTDLNEEIDNILDNLGPAGVDDYSTSAAQMKLTTSPGATGSESLATSLAGEVERLRYVIKRIIGSAATNWYDAPSSDITNLVASLGSGLPGNRIVSGRSTGNSSQLCVFIPTSATGTAAAVVLSASVTPFVYFIAGTSYTIATNQTISGLSLGPSTNNTCSVNETASTTNRFLGQYGTTIEVDGMQSNVATLLTNIAGFKSAGGEYFLGYISTTTAITNAWRGPFFDSSGTSVPPLALANNDEIKAMKIAWLYANTSSSIAVSYTNPTISPTQPTGANTGDYWFDLATTAWKTFNSTTWVSANAILTGITLQDTASCVAARTLDQYTANNGLNTMNLDRISNTVVQATSMFQQVCVFGNTNNFMTTRPSWDITANLDSASTRTATSFYYFYMKENGAPVVSIHAPSERKDLRGLYYPSELWRCLGSAGTDSSSNFITPIRSFRDAAISRMLMGSVAQYDATNTTLEYQHGQDIFPNDIVSTCALAVATWPITIGSYGDITTMALTGGVWEVSLNATISPQGTPDASVAFFGLSTASGNNFPEVYDGFNFIQVGVPTVANAVHSVALPNFYVRCSGTTNFYLKGRISNGTAALVQLTSWGLRARRVDNLVGTP